MPFVDVIIDGSGPHLDRFFTYSVPAELQGELALGQYLRVPWGKREKGAFLFAFRDSLPEGLSSEEVKDIRSIVDSRPVLDELHRELANWLRVFYYGTWPLAVVLHLHLTQFLSQSISAAQTTRWQIAILSSVHFHKRCVSLASPPSPWRLQDEVGTICSSFKGTGFSVFLSPSPFWKN